MFDVLLFVVLVAGIGVLARISYELGVDDGWTQSGDWAERNAEALTFTLDSAERPASRDKDA